MSGARSTLGGEWDGYKGQKEDNGDAHLLRRGVRKVSHTEKGIQKTAFSRGWWCIYASTWEVAAKGSEVQGHYQPRVSWRPAWTACHPVSRKKKNKQKATNNNNKTKAQTTTNPQN